MSFLFSWWKTSEDVKDNNMNGDTESTMEVVDRDKTEDESLVHYLQHHLSVEDEKTLPALPFQYDKTRCGVFICRHPAFLFAAVISDLDYRFLEYLNTISQKDPIFYECDDENENKIPIQELMNYSYYHEDCENIEAFCELFQCDHELYEGLVFKDMKLMDMINWMSCSSNEKQSELETIMIHVNDHFQKLYGKFQSIQFEPSSIARNEPVS